MTVRTRGVSVIIIAAAVLGIMLMPTPILAQNQSSTEEIEELRQTLKQVQERLKGLEESAQATEELKKRVEAVDSQLSKASALKDLADTIPDWIKNFKLTGDFRYRYEYIDEENDGAGARNRNRIRARFQIKGKVNDEVDAVIGLGSGDSNTPTSTNQTLDGQFSSKDLWLDLAYADWHPEAVPGLRFHGGKIKNPYAKPVGNADLLWDSDVRPEGIAAIYEKKLADGTSIRAVAGGFWVEERGADVDTSLWGAQLSAKFSLPVAEKAYAKLGVSYFDYGNIEGTLTAGAGNTQTGGGQLREDFDLVEGFAEIGVPLSDTVPFRVFGDVVNNTAASSAKTGWLVGAGIGKCKAPGSWEVVYNYRRLERDCVVGALTDADFAGGGTDAAGHKVSGGYQVSKRWQGRVTYFDTLESLSDPHDYHRLQVDLVFKF